MPPLDLRRRPVLVGVVHLPPLPGSPGYARARRGGRTLDWRRRAVRDARAYAEACFDAVIVENYGDVPFFRDRVPPETVAAMAVAVRDVVDAVGGTLAVGVNVLRNDARGALAVAAAAAASFVRVNVLAGAMVTDQGLVEGRAAEVLRERERIAPGVQVLADLRVKHAAPLVDRPIAEEALDLVERGGADAVVVTGPRTGRPVEAATLEAVSDLLAGHPLLVGSGATARNVAGLLGRATGVIVATAVERGGRTGEPVDLRRARAFRSAVDRSG